MKVRLNVYRKEPSMSPRVTYNLIASKETMKPGEFTCFSRYHQLRATLSSEGAPAVSRQDRCPRVESSDLNRGSWIILVFVLHVCCIDSFRENSKLPFVKCRRRS